MSEPTKRAVGDDKPETVRCVECGAPVILAANKALVDEPLCAKCTSAATMWPAHSSWPS